MALFRPGEPVFHAGRRVRLEALAGDQATISYVVLREARSCGRCRGTGEALVPRPDDPGLLTFRRCPRCNGLGVIPREERRVTLTVAVDELDEPPGDAYGQVRLI